MSATRPGNLERGWNDPPVFFYSAQTAAQKSPSRSPLNRRVAHPGIICSSPSGPPQDSPLLVPPSSHGTTLTPPGRPLVPFIPQTSAQVSNDKNSPQILAANENNLESDIEKLAISDDGKLLEHVTLLLTRVLDDCRPVIQTRIADDVSKKLQIMKDSWCKLPHAVKDRMLRLATALDKRKCDVAHEIHLSLMVDYITEVSQWMVGVKRLIVEAKKVPCRETEENMNCDQGISVDKSPSCQKTVSQDESDSQTQCNETHKNVEDTDGTENKTNTDADTKESSNSSSQ